MKMGDGMRDTVMVANDAFVGKVRVRVVGACGGGALAAVAVALLLLVAVCGMKVRERR